jgi:hypothetical protein
VRESGVILSGGPESTTESKAPVAAQAVFELGVPVLGICYGMQTMAMQLGARVTPSTDREFGYAQVTASAPCKLLDGLRDHSDSEGRALFDVWMSHGDRVDAVPPGFVACGNGRRVASLLRRTIPSRSHAYLAGFEDSRALRARDLRLRSALAARQHQLPIPSHACVKWSGATR